MKRPQVVIIGAGPGGLASALLMASRGADVRILERQPRVGGRTSALTADGFRFDLGPTFFLYPRVLEGIFQEIGRNLWDEVPMRRLDPQYRLIFGQGGRLDATPNLSRMEQAVSNLSPEDSGAFSRFLCDNRQKLAAFRPILESPFSNSWDLFRPEVLKALKWLNPHQSLGIQLRKYFRDPRLVLAFSFQSKYLGMSPFRCPSLFSILSFLEYEHGVFHPFGGCSRVMERMAEIAEELGVQIHLNEPVEEILFDGRQAKGVRTERKNYGADAVVINADFAHAMHRLVPDSLRRRWTNRRIAKKKFSCSTFMMYLGVEGTFRDLAHHTIYMAKDYDCNLQEIEQQKILSADPSFYVQNACRTDPSLAPSGMSTLYILVPVPHKSPHIDWQTARDPFRKRTLDQLAKIGLPDLESRIRFERIITPHEWETGYGIYRGATFNLAHNLGQMLHRRPQNRFEDLRNVYLVGGGTHPGSGLPVIFESARITSRLLAEDLELACLPSVTAEPGRSDPLVETTHA